MQPSTRPAIPQQQTGATSFSTGSAHPLTTVARLREEAQIAAEHVVARACAARALGATAQMHRAGALELERQAERAERLLFGQVVKAYRVAAVENRLVADALDAMDGYW